MTSSVSEIEPSDWLKTKIDITRQRIEVWSWLSARWKALIALFPTVYDTWYQKFQNFGHVTADVITGHVTQISEIFFEQKVPLFILGKVTQAKCVKLCG